MNTPPSIPDSSGPSDLDRRLLLGAAGVVGMVALSRLAQAGPIAPPSGPVASTAKPLSEVEPRVAVNSTNTPGDSTANYVISSSGAYYLSSNLTAQAGKIALKITAQNVTLDLNGFTIEGNTVGTIGVNAPIAAGGSTLTITNGVVRGFQGAGVSVYAQSMIVQNVSVQDCTGIGLDLSGNTIRVLACAAFRNGSHGFSLSGGSVSNCVAENNTGTGFNGVGTVVYENCVGLFNTAGGFSASTLRATACVSSSGSGPHFLGVNGISADNCVARFGSAGFRVTNAGSMVDLNGCVAELATGVGFDLGSGSGGQVSGCVARACSQVGFSLPSAATATSCTARGNGGAGFSGTASTFVGCTANSNGTASPTNSGFTLGPGCRVENCSSVSNGVSGYNLSGQSMLTNSFASSNGSSGVAMSAGDNVVDSCTVVGNFIGILSSVGGNTVTRNRVKGSTGGNFALTGTNFVGPSVTSAAAVSSAGAWANFEF